MGGVQGGVAGGHRRQFIDFQVRVFLDAWDVIRLWIQRDLTLVGLELLQAHVVVGGDREDQRVGRWLAAEVVRVGLEAHLGVLGVAGEDERAGADRLGVEVIGLAGLEQLVGVFGGVNRGKRHGQVGQERCFTARQGKDHSVIVGLLDALEQFLEAHAFKVRVAHVGLGVPRVFRVQLALEAPKHVVGVQVARGFEVVGGVELDVVTQVEGVGQAVGADLREVFGQRRDHFGGAGLEVHQAVEHSFGGGVGGDGRGVQDRIETFRTGFGADHQRFGRNANRHAQQRSGNGGL